MKASLLTERGAIHLDVIDCLRTSFAGQAIVRLTVQVEPIERRDEARQALAVRLLADQWKYATSYNLLSTPGGLELDYYFEPADLPDHERCLEVLWREPDNEQVLGQLSLPAPTVPPEPRPATAGSGQTAVGTATVAVAFANLVQWFFTAVGAVFAVACAGLAVWSLVRRDFASAGFAVGVMVFAAVFVMLARAAVRRFQQAARLALLHPAAAAAGGQPSGTQPVPQTRRAWLKETEQTVDLDGQKVTFEFSSCWVSTESDCAGNLDVMVRTIPELACDALVANLQLRIPGYDQSISVNASKEMEGGIVAGFTINDLGSNANVRSGDFLEWRSNTLHSLREVEILWGTKGPLRLATVPCVRASAS